MDLFIFTYILNDIFIIFYFITISFVQNAVGDLLPAKYQLLLLLAEFPSSLSVLFFCVVLDVSILIIFVLTYFMCYCLEIIEYIFISFIRYNYRIKTYL